MDQIRQIEVCIKHHNEVQRIYHFTITKSTTLADVFQMIRDQNVLYDDCALMFVGCGDPDNSAIVKIFKMHADIDKPFKMVVCCWRRSRSRLNL